MTNLDVINSRILEKNDLKRRLSMWRLKDHEIVFTNGCFDLIHLGHVDFLAKAADMGDKLIIGINSDQSVTKIKGADRPINNQLTRTSVLASFSFVAAVTIFDEETPYELIKLVQPDVLVKGSDWNKDEIVGADIVEKKGGEVKIIDLLDGYSTSIIENKIRSHKQTIKD